MPGAEHSKYLAQVYNFMENSKGIALVTGGSGGIGAACCRALHDAGFKVGIHCNSSRTAADALSAELPGSFVIQADISTVEGIDQIYDILKKDHNGEIAVLVNNAGIALDNPIFNASLEEFEKTINTNLRSVWYLSKRLVRFMIRKKSGKIINISSVVGIAGNPTQSIYGMTKAGIDNFTRTAAKEFASYGILVNSVAPGYIRTSMTDQLPKELIDDILKFIPLGRMGTPEEVAQMVRFLAESGTYITGNVFQVNGGMYG